MEQQDRLQQEIEQLGKMLAALVARLVGAPGQQGKETHSNAAITNELAEITGTGDFLHTDSASLVRQLKNDQRMSDANLELIADLFAELAMRSADKTGRGILDAHAYAIYDDLDESSATFSIERQSKKERLRRKKGKK